MTLRPEAPREIALPASVFAVLRASLSREAGALPALHALHAAGYAAGEAAAAPFVGPEGDATRALPEGEFWARITNHFARRGWGSLTHEGVHPAVGTLVSPDWVEADGAEGEDASCSFATGYLSGLLTVIAGGPVAVLEVTCRGRGDGACRFAFGNAEAIHELYGRLVEGDSLDAALASL